jgi:hypothetical protein
MELADISKMITQGFDEKYKQNPFISIFERRYPDEFKNDIKMVSFSGNFLECYDDISRVIDRVALKLLPHSGRHGVSRDITNAISVARRKCVELATNLSHGIIDLENFLRNMVSESSLAMLINEDLVEFLKIKQRCNASIRKAEDQFYQPNGDGGSMSPFFVSVFFPFGVKGDLLDSMIKEYFGSKKTLTSSNNTHWDEFVEAAYRHLG